MNETVLQLVSVTRSYGQGESLLNVLKGADLQINAGELVALTAPSGTGKSTLLHIAGLLEAPSSGDVIVGGRNTGKLNDGQRTSLRSKTIGFIYQFHHLLPEFTALENVMMPQLIAGVAKTDARQRSQMLLGDLGLSERLKHRPSEMSGGEQQRVAIARAMANAPALLLADEPTGNLDPKTSENVFAALMEAVRGAKLAALIATHNLDLAAKMDRHLTVQDGKVAVYS